MKRQNRSGFLNMDRLLFSYMIFLRDVGRDSPWNQFKIYEKVVDAIIPKTTTKYGQKFGL